MIELKNDCIVLEGFVCSGDQSASGLFCPREAYPLFREAWLRRVEERAAAAAQDAAEPLPAEAAQPAVVASQADDPS